ncbi:protein Wfdc21-like [Cavia porcellus]|uniref:WAP domain-containing protein n=1 Tax=Cavia porcellus TaxID=10141 RepID=A0A286XVP9_CAVPO|nr:protein Wfdc21-like [Cavia porcellus]
MKLGGLLLLGTLITLSLVVQELQAAVRPLQLLGTCIDLCKSDWDCSPEEKCVIHECSHICVEREEHRASSSPNLV